MKTQLKY